MTSSPIATLVKMLETLPEDTQSQVVEHLRAYIADLQDKQRWETAFRRTRKQLIAARRAKQEIAAGQAEPMDYSRL